MESPLLRLLFSSRSISKHCRHRQIVFLIGWFLKNLLLWNRFAKWTEISRNHLWKVLCKDCSFCPVSLRNMDATAILVSDWSFSKNLGQINRNLVGRFYVRFSIKNIHFILICEQTWPSWQFLFLVSQFLKNLLWRNCLACTKCPWLPWTVLVCD